MVTRKEKLLDGIAGFVMLYLSKLAGQVFEDGDFVLTEYYRSNRISGGSDGTPLRVTVFLSRVYRNTSIYI